MSYTVVIYGDDLKKSDLHAWDMVIAEPQATIIRGTVYDKNKQPSVQAIIEVRQINPRNCKVKILGYTYTDVQGQYAFSIVVNERRCYDIKVYAPLA